MILILSFLQIFLHTMRKYVLEVVVKSGVSPSQELCLPLQDTTFIAVSTYHNRDVAQLKIQHNHYARNAHPTNKSPLPYSVASVAILLWLHLTQLLPWWTTWLPTAGLPCPTVLPCPTGLIPHIYDPRMPHHVRP